MSNQGANYNQMFGGQGAYTNQNQQRINISQDFPSLGGDVSQQNQPQMQQDMYMQQQQQYMGYQQQPNQWNNPQYGQQYGMMHQNMQQMQIDPQYMMMMNMQQMQTQNQFGQIPQMFIPGQSQTTTPQQQVQQPVTISATPTPDASGASTATASSSFKVTSSEFVPKKKIVKTEEQFPTLGATEPVKKKVAPTVVKKEEPEKEQNKDPTFGKPKEFFQLVVPNPAMPPHPLTNPLSATYDQMTFIYINYPDYATNPVEIIQWLYDVACFNEVQAQQMKNALEGEKAYTKPPQNRYKNQNKGKGKKNNEDDSDDENEDTNYTNMRDLRKKKPQPTAPKQPEIPIEVLEARRKRNEEKKLKNINKPTKEKVVDVNQLVNEQLVEVDETRQPVSMVFIGHVDAGKSTISGNLMFAMGVVDQRTIQKYKEEAKEKNRESWWLAYVMDVNEEEKAKGKTVEIGRATFDTPKKRWTIFDAPGHKNYVPNMIMGAALADYGALVISAKKGEFESGFDFDGQTREHVQLAKSLGIFKLVIVVNKMDEPSVKWSKDRYNEIITNLKPFIQSCGYDPEKDCIYIPVSGLNGDNIKDEMNKAVCNWYQGPTLLQVLDDLDVPPRDANGPLRIPILDKMRDRGVVVFGKVESGTVNLGDKLTVMPQNLLCQVQTIYNSKSEPVKYAKPGENVQIRLLNVNDENAVNKGDMICIREAPVPVSDLIEAEVEVLELLSYKPILSKGYQCILHIHTVADEATIKEILVSYEKNDKGDVIEKQKPQFTKSYSRIICRIQMRIPVPLEKHDFLQQMGRFTLRDEGKTIALGKVLKYKPAKITQQQTLITGAKPGVTAQQKTNEESKGEEEKTTQIDTSSQQNKAQQDLIYDLDSGETITREEFNKRQQQRDLEAVGEDDEDEEDDN